MEIKEKPFICKRDAFTIRGMQYVPYNFQEREKYPIVIISHGFKGNYMSMADFGKDFAKIGYVAFCFSFCGSRSPGESESDRSDGEPTDMTISSQIQDLTAVKNFAMKQTYADADSLILAGGSQGGFISGLSAAAFGDEVKKLIMIFPALCIPDDARRGRLGGGSYDPKAVPDKIDCKETFIGKAFHEEAVHMDPYLNLSQYKGAVLILHGIEDELVHYSYSVRAQECYGKERCHLQLIRDMGHGYQKEQRESIFASIRQFLADRIEILTIRVIIHRQESTADGEVNRNRIFFTAYCDSKYFQGITMSEGCDETIYSQEEKHVKVDYTLSGIDFCGEQCSIHIINQFENGEWRPKTETDSCELEWLNHADLTAVPEYCKGGPVIRIFAVREALP